MKHDIPYDGYGNVLEMLKRADSTFREKILKNLRIKDPVLAKRLEQSLQQAAQAQQQRANNSSGRSDDSRAALERSQRAANTRNYGN